MADSKKEETNSKIYCEKCNTVFISKKKYEEHYSKHDSNVYCESCPIDVAVSKIVNLFKRGK